MIGQAERDGARKAQALIRSAINEENPLFGACGPHLPKKTKGLEQPNAQ